MAMDRMRRQSDKKFSYEGASEKKKFEAKNKTDKTLNDILREKNKKNEAGEQINQGQGKLEERKATEENAHTYEKQKNEESDKVQKDSKIKEHEYNKEKMNKEHQKIQEDFRKRDFHEMDKGDKDNEGAKQKERILQGQTFGHEVVKRIRENEKYRPKEEPKSDRSR